MDALQYAIGAFFMLLFLRLILRTTWLAAAVLIAFSLLLAENAGTVYALAGATFFCVVVLRVGLWAGTAMLISQRLLTRIPMTLELDVWYSGTTIVAVLLVIGLALWGFSAAMTDRRLHACAL